MSRIRVVVALSVLFMAGAAEGAAQAGPATAEPVVVQPLSLSGPRVGITYLSPGIEAKAEELVAQGIAPVVTQFGWQWETRFFSIEDGPTGVSEWVLLAGGLEQGLFLPSLTWLVGLRSSKGAEFGVGPNLTPAGAALALAGGVTVRNGPINFPLNVAVVPSSDGVRVSFLAGFNMRRDRTPAVAAGTR